MYQRGNQFDAKLNDEFGRLEQAINLPVDAVRLDARSVVPLKVRIGTLAYADGANWNPGAGAGPYCYTGTEWKSLGGESGTYAPSLTNSVNITSSTAYVCQWMRVGNTVTVSGKVTIDPTVAGLVQLGMSLPIASNFSSDEQCAGTASTGAQFAAIKGNATDDNASIFWTASDDASYSWFFTFTYQVV